MLSYIADSLILLTTVGRIVVLELMELQNKACSIMEASIKNVSMFFRIFDIPLPHIGTFLYSPSANFNKS